MGARGFQRVIAALLIVTAMQYEVAHAETPLISPRDVTSNSGGTICFYVDSPHFRLTGPYKSIRTGHAFVGLSPDSGPQQGNTGLVYGHVPAGTLGGINPFSSGGKTEGQSDHPWDYRICYHVDAGQYNAAAKFIRGEITSPSDFHLFGRNCTDWIDRVAGAAGLHIPRTTDPSAPHIKDPAVFEDNLERLSPQRTYEGGRVTHHVVTSMRSQFDLNSVRGLGTAGLLAPRELAAGLKIPVISKTLPTIRLSIGQRISLAYTGVEPGAALVAVRFNGQVSLINNWGPSYIVARAGTVPIQIAVLQAHRLFYATFNVVAEGSGGPTTRLVRIAVPPER
jgi:hypothetical protein